MENRKEDFSFSSQVCTTVLQSERLIGLGLRPETSDCYYNVVESCFEFRSSISDVEKYDYVSRSFTSEDMSYLVPCWSLNRLMEMLPSHIWFDGSCHTLVMSNRGVCYIDYDRDSFAGDYFDINGIGNMYGGVVDLIEWLIGKGYFDRRYLRKEVE